MDIRGIVQGLASRASGSAILEKVENFILDKLYKEPISKENEKTEKEHEKVFGKEEEIKEPKDPRG